MKGRSGNPRGRPRGALGLKAILRRENQRRITITVNDRERRVTVRQAIAMRIAMLCAQGDPRMFNLAIETNYMDKLQPLIIALLPEDEEDEEEI
jgi:hypothetical protein